MHRFLKLKIPVIIIAAALGWAFLADPLISHVAQRPEPRHRDLFRSLNDFIVLLLVSLALYRRISHQAREVRKTRDDYRRLFDGIPTPMYIYDDLTLRVLAVNDAAVEQYGYTREEFLNLKITDIRPPEEVPELVRFHEALPEDHVDAGRWLHINKAGQRFYVSVYTHYTIFEGKSARQVLIVNIDEKNAGRADRKRKVS